MACCKLIAAPIGRTCDFEVTENASVCLNILLSSSSSPFGLGVFKDKIIF